ncbi:hypothetical protein [[Clostridium] polysaccharolyticum]|uniref:Uncharacterized protein n=1 Tax=[Clostridium] polysaccharolyticum TaxID=29364 RepID=A0A1I0EUC5_9FIRM|nr:hypothetical protein [[Clostridium] polysaccharolyticum]SET49174.1 hypothetical protein SAMN04487772_12512 [[Clostridium] polysaccharolyticum]
MGIWIFQTLCISLIMTLLLELLFCLAAGIREKKDLLLACLVNVLTNPFVVLVHYIALYYTKWNHILVVGILEIGAVIVEGICYKSYGKKIPHPFYLSLFANLFSYGTGLLINILN